MSGITYYKLSEHLYPGDATKDCGLTGAEIDANFHFLRGYDILSGKLLEDGTIVLTRLDEHNDARCGSGTPDGAGSSHRSLR